MNKNTAIANRQITKDEFAIFIMILDAPKNKVEKLFNELKEQTGGWVLKVIEKRFNIYDIKVDKKTMIMIFSMGDGIVGRCVKYVDDIVHWCKENMVSELKFDIFNERIYLKR